MTSLNSWDELKHRLKVGDLTEGVVIRHERYGVFVDIGCDYYGLIQITDFKDIGAMKSEEYPPLGACVKVVVLGFKEAGKQIWLSIRPSRVRPMPLS